MKESNVLAFPQQTTTKPGMYLRSTINYADIDAVNQSTLKEILRSPAHYEYRLANPKEPTDAMRVGTATHTAVLEPIRLTTEYAIWEDTRIDEKSGKTIKQVRNGSVWDQFQAQHAGKTIVRECDLAEAMAMRDAVAANKLARHTLRDGKGTNETTIVWVEPTTKTLCKSRLDRCGPLDGQDVVIDLKGWTPQNNDSSRQAFANRCARMNYHFQAAFYSDAYQQVTGRKPIYLIVAVEMTAPHDIAVYELRDADIEKGRKLYQEALHLRAECLAAKSWPGVGANMVQALELPEWAAGDNDNDLELIIGGESVGV